VTWIKICGTTSERDADIAIRAGANALGFIMWPQSPRHVTETAAYSIGTLVPKSVETIGVFVDEDLATVVQTTQFCRFTGVQLHGAEDQNYVVELRKRLPGVKIFKVVKAAVLGPSTDLKPDAWLIDSANGRMPGGTGNSFNWHSARAHVARLKEPVIVAGGLNSQNVGEALEILRPWGVDVVSGVESYPGRKHPGAVAQFIDAVRQFDGRCEKQSSQNRSR
jgi:phosphoribosylanthranilate isomerase